MAETMRVDVVSPESIVWSGEAEFIVAKTVDGEIGILANHEPLMAALATGAVDIIPAEGERLRVGVHGEFFQVCEISVTLLTERATLVEGDVEPAWEAAAALDSEADTAACAPGYAFEGGRGKPGEVPCVEC